jgi:hypothetical protein
MVRSHRDTSEVCRVDFCYAFETYLRGLFTTKTGH